MRKKTGKTKRLSRNAKYRSVASGQKALNSDYIDMIDGMQPGDLFVFGWYDWKNIYKSKQDAIVDTKHTSTSHDGNIMCMLLEGQKTQRGVTYKKPKSLKNYVKHRVGECGMYVGKKYISSSSPYAKTRRVHCFLVDGKTIIVPSQNYANVIPL